MYKFSFHAGALEWRCSLTIFNRLEEFAKETSFLLICLCCALKGFSLIKIAVDQNLWSPIQLSRGGPQLSYLAFADDILLFVEATPSQAEVLKKVLDTFYKSSGQKVNADKTRIYSRNVHWKTNDQVANHLGFQRTADLGKYLGVPLHHERVSKQNYQFLLDKVNSRLSNWKASNLSMAGRMTLTKAILQALPNYVMQTTYLPASVSDEIDKKCRQLLCGEIQQITRRFMG